MGASCRLYGGRNSKLITLRYRLSNGSSSRARWYLALSRTITMRLACERCRSNFLRKASNVRASNLSPKTRTNLPELRLTEPKQATDLRVGAWSNTGSLISGGTHIRQRVPCCWKWHSSKPHKSTSLRLASCRSFFESRDLYRVGLRYLESGLPQSESHLTEDALALAYTQAQPIVQPQVLREELAVPQMGSMTEFRGVASQVAPQSRPLPSVQRGRPSRSLGLAQTFQAMRLETPHPALHRAAIFTEQFGYLFWQPCPPVTSSRPCSRWS